MPYKHTVTDRFLRYVTFDTQSDENSSIYPSTDKQWVLLKELEKELNELGLSEVVLDKYGYLTALLPSNLDYEAPTIGFFAHVDTSSSVSGANVRPIIHRNYQGQELILPADSFQKINLQTNPELAQMFGQDLITSDGTTLLGGDDKCGVAEIMDACHYFVTHPEVKHGNVKVCFNPDEEIGRGTEFFDVEMFGANSGYTLDGPGVGVLETENFNAAEMTLNFVGKNYHPGYAKGKLVNSLKVATNFVNNLPQDQSPETTEGRQGYIHVMGVQGNEELTTVKLILRDFETLGLADKRTLVETLANQSTALFSGSSVSVQYKEQYYNMKSILQKTPQIVQKTIQAYKKLGVEPTIDLIRGGTDGVMLAQKGLPCPNLSSAQHNAHAKTEFTSVQEMQLAVRMIILLVEEWSGK